MTANIEKRKIDLIAFIAALQQDEAIKAFEKIVKKLKPKNYKKENSESSIVSEADIEYFKRPVRKTITADELAREQNWQPIDEAKMDELVKLMDIQEPIELLLSQLTK